MGAEVVSKDPYTFNFKKDKVHFGALPLKIRLVIICAVLLSSLAVLWQKLSFDNFSKRFRRGKIGLVKL